MKRIIYRAIVEGFKSRFVNEEQPVIQEEFVIPVSSLNEFSDMLEQVDFQIRFLASLIYRVAQVSETKEDGSIRILRRPSEIGEYLFNNEADCVMLPSSAHMPVVLKSKDLGWIKDTDGFADWLMEHWTPDTLVIAVS